MSVMEFESRTTSWGPGWVWESMFVAMLADKISTRPDAQALAQYLCGHLVVPLECRYVAFVQAGEWVDPTEWGACRNSDQVSTPCCSPLNAVCGVVRGIHGRSGFEGGCMHVRSLDQTRMLWLAVEVSDHVEESTVDEVLDLVAPVLAFYARSYGSNLRRPVLRTSQAPELTPRQRLILELISEGLTNPSIARRIGFSESLVRHEIMAIFKILGCRTRTDAVAAARGSGLLPLALSS